jgi:quercetin dioxygenase-like cupin family protein
MKKILLILFMISSYNVLCQSLEYDITSYKDEGFKAPNINYIGEAWLNSLIQAGSDINYGITKAYFKANSTLDWHKHSSVQVIVVVDGEGYYQERGKDAILMKEGDVIKCPIDTEHWHASSKSKDVTYLAIYGGSTPTIWTEKLSQEYYDMISEQLKEN